MSGFKLSDASSSHPAQRDEPLHLTVHSIPVPQDGVPDDARRVRMGRWKMILVALVCATPVVASYFTYYVVRPEGRRNHGELIDPQRPLPDVAATSLQGQGSQPARPQGPVAAGQRGRRRLRCRLPEAPLSAAPDPRGPGQGQGPARLGLADPRRCPRARGDAPRPGAGHGLRVPQAQLAQWLTPAAGHALADHLYVVDPKGNWMMRFPAGLDPAGAAKAKRDLERMMRASVSWDEAGRPQAPR